MCLRCIPLKMKLNKAGIHYLCIVIYQGFQCVHHANQRRLCVYRRRRHKTAVAGVLVEQPVRLFRMQHHLAAKDPVSNAAPSLGQVSHQIHQAFHQRKRTFIISAGIHAIQNWGNGIVACCFDSIESAIYFYVLFRVPEC